MDSDMKKISTILLSIAAALVIGFTATSCEDYLDKAPDSDITPADAFGDFTAFQGFIEQEYNLVIGYDKCGAWNRFSFADENLTISTDAFDTGNWWSNEGYFFGTGPNVTAVEGRNKRVWECAWYGIRVANHALSVLDSEDCPFVGTDEERNLIKGQALFFRAFNYYEICRYWGGMPYVTHFMDASEDMFGDEFKRLTAQESFIKMAEDFAAAAKLLPNHWDEAVAGASTSGNNNLRANKFWALGFQGKALLWAASPMLNEEAGKGDSFNGDLAKQAADALGEFFNLCEETGWKYYDLEPWATYDNIFAMINYVRPGGKEVIMQETLYGRTRVRWSSLGATVPASLGMNSSTTCQESPTANIIKNYCMKNGLPIDDPDSGYDPEHPWENREPRFDKTIITDGDPICTNLAADRNAELFNGGRHRNGGSYGAGSPTGLLFRKYNLLGPNWHSTSWTGGMQAHTPYLRMAEIYLMYAEAVNWMTGGGPTAKASNYSLTAVQALNKVRERGQIPDLTAKYYADKETFFETIVRERAVELMMEAHRFDDLRRWNRIADPRYLDKTRFDFKRGADGRPEDLKEVVQITRTASQPKMNWLPIQVKFTKMYAGFPQNPGW